MKRGDIYWVNLDPTAGSEIKKMRPCVVISATPINQARHTVIVVPLSKSAKARPPIAVTICCMKKNVTAICDQIRTIDKSRIGKSVGQISFSDLEILEENLRQVLAL